MKAKQIPAIFFCGLSFLTLLGSSDLFARSRDDRYSRPDVEFKAKIEWGTDEGVKLHGSVNGVIQDERGNYLKREIGWGSDGKASTSLSKGRSSIDGNIEWREEEIINLNEPQNTLSEKKDGWGYEKFPYFQEKTKESLGLASADIPISSKIWDKEYIAFLSPFLLPIETILSLKFLFNYLVLPDCKFQDLRPVGKRIPLANVMKEKRHPENFPLQACSLVPEAIY